MDALDSYAATKHRYFFVFTPRLCILPARVTPRGERQRISQLCCCGGKKGVPGRSLFARVRAASLGERPSRLLGVRRERGQAGPLGAFAQL